MENNLVVNASEISVYKDKLGTFTFKRLTIKGLISRGVKYTEYTSGKEVDVSTSNMAWQIATLEHAIVNKPDWFNLDDIYEYEVLEELYQKYDVWVNSFRKDISKENKKNS